MKYEDFIKESRADLERFDRWWRKNCKDNPEYFTMEIPDDNAGSYSEQLIEFLLNPDMFDPPIDNRTSDVTK